MVWGDAITATSQGSTGRSYAGPQNPSIGNFFVMIHCIQCNVPRHSPTGFKRHSAGISPLSTADRATPYLQMFQRIFCGIFCRADDWSLVPYAPRTGISSAGPALYRYRWQGEPRGIRGAFRPPAHPSPRPVRPLRETPSRSRRTTRKAAPIVEAAFRRPVEKEFSTPWPRPPRPSRPRRRPGTWWARDRCGTPRRGGSGSWPSYPPSPSPRTPPTRTSRRTRSRRARR